MLSSGSAPVPGSSTVTNARRRGLTGDRSRFVVSERSRRTAVAVLLAVNRYRRRRRRHVGHALSTDAAGQPAAAAAVQHHLNDGRPHDFRAGRGRRVRQ